MREGPDHGSELWRPSHISDDIATARDQVRRIPAMVSNDVRDLIAGRGAGRRPGLQSGKATARQKAASPPWKRHGKQPN
jgi:hypothetical protein